MQATFDKLGIKDWISVGKWGNRKKCIIHTFSATSIVSSYKDLMRNGVGFSCQRLTFFFL